MAIVLKGFSAVAIVALLAGGQAVAQEPPRMPESGTEMPARPIEGGTKGQPRATDTQATGTVEGGATERERRAQERSNRATKGICSGC